MKLTLVTVNAALRALEAGETLVKGKGYFYFIDGESSLWKQQSVYVSSLNELTLEQWIQEYTQLNENRN